jgi:hypothetical protein
VTALEALDADHDDRVAVWQAALKALAAELPALYPVTQWQDLTSTIAQPPDLLGEKYRSPLNLQVAALTALLQAAAEPVANAGSPEEILLGHVEGYWRDSANTRGLKYQPGNLKLAVAAATPAGASSDMENHAKQVAVETVDLIPVQRLASGCSASPNFGFMPYPCAPVCGDFHDASRPQVHEPTANTICGSSLTENR